MKPTNNTSFNAGGLFNLKSELFDLYFEYFQGLKM